MGIWGDVWGGIKSFGGWVLNGFIGSFSQLILILQTIIAFGLSAADFILTLLGIELPKKIRVAFVILLDETGKPLVSPSAVEPTVQEAKRVLGKLHVSIVSATSPMISTATTIPPADALETGCGASLWVDEFNGNNDYFRENSIRNLGSYIGYAGPVTVFIIRNVADKGGCSLGFLADWVVVDTAGLGQSNRRVPVHEIAHACNLVGHLLLVQHSDNLMLRDDHGDNLGRWQRAVFRSSRHVTFF